MSAGFQLIAISFDGNVIATYSEAVDGQGALRICYEEFPKSEGWSGHYSEDVETHEITSSLSWYSGDEAIATNDLITSHYEGKPAGVCVVNPEGPPPLSLELDPPPLSLEI